MKPFTRSILRLLLSIICITAAVVLSVSLAACGGGEENEPAPGPDLPPKRSCTEPGMCT